MQNKYNIVYLPISEEDIEEIFNYILTDNPDYAPKLISPINESVQRLSDFPHIGFTPKDPFIAQMNYRILVVDSYLIFYVVLDNTIEIRRIINGKRKYDYLL